VTPGEDHLFIGSLGLSGSLVVRPRPGSPSTTILANAGDTVMVEEKISFKFAQVGYRQPATRDTSEQGPEHSRLRVSHRGERNVPQINFGIEQNQPEQIPPEPPGMRPTTRAIASLPTPTRWIFTAWPMESSPSTMIAAPWRLMSTVWPSSRKSAPCFPAPERRTGSFRKTRSLRR